MVNNRKSHLKRNYNLTLEDYNQLLKQHGGVCAICNQLPERRKLAIDHDHKTGRIRGLLCFHCNDMLGRLERHSNLNFILDRVREYLS